MRFLPLLLFLSVAFISCPLFAGPIVSRADSGVNVSVSSDFSNPGSAGSLAALGNLDVFFELTVSDELMTSDGSSPEGGSKAEELVRIFSFGGSLDPLEGGTYSLPYAVIPDGTFFSNDIMGLISVVAERATADGVVTTAKSAFDVELTVEAHADHGPVNLFLNYDVLAVSSSITGAGTMGDEMFFGTAVASSTLTSGDVTLDSLEVSVNSNDIFENAASRRLPFTLAAGESVTFKISTMAQATATAVPEPSSFLLLGMLGLVGAWRQRFSKSKVS